MWAKKGISEEPQSSTKYFVLIHPTVVEAISKIDVWILLPVSLGTLVMDQPVCSHTYTQ